MNDTPNVSVATDDEIVMYLLIRADLSMPKGKIAAQAGHAVQLVIRAVERTDSDQAKQWLREWEAGSYAKIPLRLDGHDWFAWMKNAMHGIVYVEVVDEGRTSVEPGTMTAVGLQPMPRSRAREIIGKMKLL